MKTTNRFLMLGAMMFASWIASSSASAQCTAANNVTTCNSPYGSTVAVEIRVGSQIFGNQYVVWKRRDNGACTVSTVIGNWLTGLNFPTVINGSNAGDLVVVQSTLETHCGMALNTPVSGGKSLEVYGKDGGDVLLASLPASFVSGGQGNDIVVGSDPNARLIGDQGDDDVESWSTGSGEWLLGDTLTGGTGNDCIYDKSHVANVVNCSGGTADKYVAPITFSPGGHNFLNECEQIVTCCPWAHLVGDC